MTGLKMNATQRPARNGHPCRLADPLPRLASCLLQSEQRRCVHRMRNCRTVDALHGFGFPNAMPIPPFPNELPPRPLPRPLPRPKITQKQTAWSNRKSGGRDHAHAARPPRDDTNQPAPHTTFCNPKPRRDPIPRWSLTLAIHNAGTTNLGWQPRLPCSRAR